MFQARLKAVNRHTLADMAPPPFDAKEITPEFEFRNGLGHSLEGPSRRSILCLTVCIFEMPEQGFSRCNIRKVSMQHAVYWQCFRAKYSYILQPKLNVLKIDKLVNAAAYPRETALYKFKKVLQYNELPEPLLLPRL